MNLIYTHPFLPPQKKQASILWSPLSKKNGLYNIPYPAGKYGKNPKAVIFFTPRYSPPPITLNLYLTIQEYIGVSVNSGTPKTPPKWSFLVGKPMVVGYHHLRKHPYMPRSNKKCSTSKASDSFKGFIRKSMTKLLQSMVKACCWTAEGGYLPGNNGPSVSWLVRFLGKPTNLGFRTKTNRKKKHRMEESEMEVNLFSVVEKRPCCDFLR